MKLTKEEFKTQLKHLQDYFHKEDDFCGCLESMVGDGIIPAFIYTQPVNDILELLHKMFEDESDNIGYFLYELDAINSEDLKVEDGPKDENGKVLYNDADSLYDYLTGEKE